MIAQFADLKIGDPADPRELSTKKLSVHEMLLRYGGVQNQGIRGGKRHRQYFQRIQQECGWRNQVAGNANKRESNPIIIIEKTNVERLLATQKVNWRKHLLTIKTNQQAGVSIERGSKLHGQLLGRSGNRRPWILRVSEQIKKAILLIQ